MSNFLPTIGDWTPLQLRQFVIETIKQTEGCRFQKSHSSDYHTKAQIVSLIEQNLPTLREQFGSDTFQPATFKHALKLLTTLKPGDLEQMKDGVTRWDEITWNAMQASPWLKHVGRNKYQLIAQGNISSVQTTVLF